MITHLCLKFLYSDIMIGTIASQISSLTTVYSTVYSDTDQSTHQSSASLNFVRGIHRGPVNSPDKWPVTRKMFPFDDVMMFMAVFSLKPYNSWYGRPISLYSFEGYCYISRSSYQIFFSVKEAIDNSIGGDNLLARFIINYVHSLWGIEATIAMTDT